MQAPQLKNSHWESLADNLAKSLFEELYNNLLKTIKSSNQSLLNSKNDLIAAIKSGRIRYDGTYFRGKLNSKITKELRKFAKFDKRAKAYRGLPPDWLMPTILATTAANTKLLISLKNVINKINVSQVVSDIIDKINFAETLRKIDRDVLKTATALSVIPDVDFSEVRPQIDFAVDGLKRSVKNLADQQTTRLRDIAEKSIIEGYSRKDLQAIIHREFDLCKDRAKFIARQETSLFFSESRTLRCIQSGRGWYMWRTANDERVRDKHSELATKNCKRIYHFSNPPVVDDKNNRKCHPGIDFRCRCVADTLTDNEVKNLLKNGYRIDKEDEIFLK